MDFVAPSLIFLIKKNYVYTYFRFLVIMSKTSRFAVLELYKARNSVKDIVQRLGIPQRTVYYAIKRYQELGNYLDRPGRGRKRTVDTPRLRIIIKCRIHRNPRVKMRQIARSLKINREIVRKIAKEDLHNHPYELQKAHLLTDKMKLTRFERCKALLRGFANKKSRNILFTDEKLFTIEQSYNRQNDRIWSKKFPGEDRIVARSQKPKSLMVWAGFTAEGKLPLKYIDEGLKVKQEIYRRAILEDVVLPWTREHYPNNDWTFQQDSAPAHKAKLTQQ